MQKWAKIRYTRVFLFGMFTTNRVQNRNLSVFIFVTNLNPHRAHFWLSMDIIDF